MRRPRGGFAGENWGAFSRVGEAVTTVAVYFS
jgi:hypothetical protein